MVTNEGRQGRCLIPGHQHQLQAQSPTIVELQRRRSPLGNQLTFGDEVQTIHVLLRLEAQGRRLHRAGGIEAGDVAQVGGAEGLGQAAANPLRCSYRYFEEEMDLPGREEPNK